MSSSTSDGSGEVLRLAPASGVARRLVILLHGVGSSGADLMPLAQAWRGALPDTAFVAPNAPQPFDMGNGHQWFSIAGVTEENRPARVAAALPALADLIEAERQRAGVSPADVALVGFSQGSIMALHLAMTAPERCGAVVAFAGRIAAPVPTPDGSGRRPPILMVGGAADSIMPPAVVQAAATHFRSAGFAVEEHLLRGVPHTITAAGAQLGLDFLQRVLPSA
ncbi:alpha/beta fold hydrolase [Azospirillum melinis]|uniref:Alpha/beta fold hydrolase n=1 Tax=Azospirillum melinis TaxID=328839 RepID=A0ABX2KIV7_9PROT|nr:alpha/beta fold hydrolase [Azospirillum melinis]MBP2309575.1 phospholipase/carboxylesterase [Azospirillum melinis]NUB03527.1 alpha/beta fold hydrolase [Azospirillum melinis]